MSSKKHTRAEEDRPRRERDLGKHLIRSIELGDLDAVLADEVREVLASTVDTRAATSGWTPLMLAAAMGDAEIVDALLSAGADLGEALLIACALGHTKIARQLLEAGADATTQDRNGRNALSFAAQTGDRELIDALLAAGVPVDLPERASGMTALCRAALAGRSEACTALLDAGAQRNHVDHHGFTPLLYAAGSAHETACRALLEAGADPNHRSPDGRGALLSTISARAYFRLEGGSQEVRPFDEAELLPIVELLVRWGAEINVEDGTCRRAEQLGYGAIARSLAEYACEPLREAS